jgi:hypothetical protein
MMMKHRRSILRWKCVARPFLAMATAALVAYFPPSVRADTTSMQSFTGTLASPEATFETTLALTSPDDVLLQTFGFRGGTNAQGTLIASGGTDPFLAVFSGTGNAATILTDASANPFGTSLDLSTRLPQARQ